MTPPAPHELIPVIPLYLGSSALFSVLLVLTFALHILLVNLTVGVTLISFVRALRVRSAIVPTRLHEDFFLIPFFLAFTVNLAIPPFLFLQVLYGPFIYTSSILMAVWWLGMAGVVMLAYYGFYVLSYNRSALTQAQTTGIVGICSLLLLIAAFILTNNMTLMLRPSLWPAFATTLAGTGSALADPSIWARYAHILPACLAVGGLFLAVRAGWKKKHGAATLNKQQKHNLDREISSGLRWFSRATMVQFLTGLWYFMVLPAPTRMLFMGGASAPSLIFALGVFLTMASLLAARRKLLKQTVLLVLSTIVSMAYLRDVVRTHMLTPFITDTMPTPQSFVPFFLFCAAAVFTGVCMLWVLRIFWRAHTRNTGQEAH